VFPQVDLHIYERSMFAHRFYVTDCDGAAANLTGHDARLEIRRAHDALDLTAQTVVASDDSGDLLLTFADDLNHCTPVRFTSDDTLPTGLAVDTTYYLIRVSETTAHVAESLADALTPAPIAYADAGTGTHTMTAEMFVSTSTDDLTVDASGYVDLTWTGTQTEIIGNTHGPVLLYDIFIFPTGYPEQAVIISHGYVVAKKNVAIPVDVIAVPT
jgi:hypothetical protein